MSSISILIGSREFKADLYDTPTAKALLESLPLESKSITWGDEIYFHIPVASDLESDAREVVEVGDLAYWPLMPAFCIFFGPTPASVGIEPRAANPVNVFGKLREVDLAKLKDVGYDETIVIKLSEDG